MRVNGETTKCMGGVPLPGQTGESTLASTWMTKSTAMESSSGQMAALTRAIGKQENSTVKVFTLLAKALRNTESGRKENALGGSAAERGLGELKDNDTHNRHLVFLV